MTRTWSIAEFNEYLENRDSKEKENRQQRINMITFVILSLIMVGALEFTLLADVVVEAVEWF